MFIGVASCLVSTICPLFICGDIDVFSRSRSALSLSRRPCHATCCILEARADCRFCAWHHASVPRPIVRIVPACRSHCGPTYPSSPLAILPILCGFAHRSEAIHHSSDAIYFPTARADPSGPGAFPRLRPAAFGSGGHLWCSGPEGLWGHEGRSAHFPNRPVSRKSSFPKIAPNGQSDTRAPAFRAQNFPHPRDTPPDRLAKRYPTQTNAQSIPIVAQRHDKCRTNDIQHKCRLPIPPVPPIHRHPPQPATLRAQCIANIARMSLTDRRHTRDLSPNHRSNAIHQANPYGTTDQGTDTPTGHPLRRITSVTHNPNSQFFLKSPASLPPKINPVHPNPPIPTYPHTHSAPP